MLQGQQDFDRNDPMFDQFVTADQKKEINDAMDSNDDQEMCEVFKPIQDGMIQDYEVA